MRFLRMFLSSGLVFSSLGGGAEVWAKPKTLEAPVRRVIVYQDRAHVTRQGKSKLVNGRASFEVRDVTVEADLASVQVKVFSPLKLISFTPARYFKESQDNLEEKQLLETYEKKMEELRTLYQQRHLNEVVLAKVADYQKYLSEAVGRFAVSGSAPPQAWQSGLDFVRKQSDRRAEDLVRVQREIKKLTEKTRDLLRRIRSIQTSDSAKATKIDVFVESKQAVTGGKIEISYVVPRANWRPHYDLVREGNDRLNLRYYGKVSQRTGEDWNQAKITLATGRPDLGLEPPPVSSHLIVPVVRQTKEVVLKTMEEERELTNLLGEGDVGQVSTTGDATLFPKGLEIDFAIKQTKTIRANGEPHQVLIGEWKIPANIELVTYPALRPHVFYRAEGSNKTGFPLLAGTAHIFGKSGFIGKSNLEFTPLDAKFEFSLGVVQDLRVSRSFRRRKEHRGKLPGSGAKMVYWYDTHLWNFSPDSRKVMVVESIPVSNIDDVKVHLDSATKPKAKVTPEGRVIWTLELKPNEKKKVEYHYSIQAPGNFVFPKT